MNSSTYEIKDTEGYKSHPKMTRNVVYKNYNKYWGNLLTFIEKNNIL